MRTFGRSVPIVVVEFRCRDLPMGTNPLRYWYVLQCNPREEVTAWRQVESLGMEVYYPCVSVRTVNPRARKVKPYFPGYLFVRLDASTLSKHTFRWMAHIVGLVCCGDEPTPVPDALVAAIRRRVAEFALVCADPAHGMKRGDPVRIQAGPFEGYEAVFDMRMSGDNRVRVLLELINGKSVALDIQATQVDRIPYRREGR